jgi:hypothetical protein
MNQIPEGEVPSDAPGASEDPRAFTHGPMTPIGEFALELQLKKHAELRECVARVQGRIAVLREAVVLRENEGARLLAPLYAEMEALRLAWENASAAYEKQRIANQSACVELRNEISKLITEMNQPLPGFAYNVKQWQRPSWYTGPDREGDGRWYPHDDGR